MSAVFTGTLASGNVWFEGSVDGGLNYNSGPLMFGDINNFATGLFQVDGFYYFSPYTAYFPLLDFTHVRARALNGFVGPLTVTLSPGPEPFTIYQAIAPMPQTVSAGGFSGFPANQIRVQINNEFKIIGYPALLLAKEVGSDVFTAILSPRGAIIDHSGTISAGGVSQQVMPINLERRYILFQNISDTTMWLNLGAAATAGTGSFDIEPLGTFAMEGSFLATDALNVFCVSAGKAFTCKEG